MKKKITLLKVFMTLCLLLVSFGNTWGADYTNKEISFKSSTLETGWTTNGTFNSSYFKMTTGQYAQGTSTALFGTDVLSTDMTINIACGTFGSWSGNKSVKVKAIFYDSKNIELTSVEKTYTSLNSTQTTYRGEMTLSKPSNPSEIAYLKIIFSNFTTGNDLRFAGVKLTYSTQTAGPTKTLTSIAVSGTPTKTTYDEGDKFDPAGLTVTGTYNDESTAPITSGIIWSYENTDVLAKGQTSIKVKATVDNVTSADWYTVNDLTVNEFVQTYANTYTSDASLSSVITGSKVKWDGCKVTDGYDALKIAKGGTATITVPAGTKTVHLHLVAWNGESAAFAVKLGEASLSSITPTANTGVANNSPFTLTTEPKTENSYYFAIEVNADEETTLSLTATNNKRAILFGVNFEAAKERTLQSITVKTDPNKILYKVGESFDATGLVVKGTFDNGDIEDLPESKYSLSSPDMSAAGQKTITVSATGVEDASFTIDVVALDKIEITTAPNKTEYNEGDNFDPAGMVVKGTWGTEENKMIVEYNLTGYTITDGTNLQPSQTTVTISYTHEGTTKTTTQGITVTAATNKYAVTFESDTEGGTLTVKVGDDVITTGDELVEGVTVSLTSTPKDGYKQQATPFVVKDADGGDVKVSKSGDVYSFAMPAKAVIITAKFVPVYAINVAGGIKGGTIAIQDKDGNPITETSKGSKVVIAVTPNDHHSLTSLYYIKTGEETHNVIEAKEGVYSFNMIESDVTVYATFVEDAKYTVTFSIIGRLESKSNYAGEQVEFPEVSNVEDYTFMGWKDAPIIGTQQTAPEYVTSATYPEHNNTLYYAVFAKKSGSEKSESLACPAGTISNNTMTFKTANFEIVHAKGTSSNFASYSPWRIYQNNTVTVSSISKTISKMEMVTSSTNYGTWTTTAGTVNVATASGGTTSVTGINAKEVTLTNTGSQARWSNITIYYDDITFSNYCTTVSGQTIPVTVNPIGNASFCSTVNLDFTDRKDVKAYIAVNADNDRIILNRRYKIPAGTGIFVLGTGGTYNIPTTTEECNDVSENKLTGTIVPYTVQDEDNVWALSKTDGKLHHVATDVTIGAGKAYYSNGSLGAVSLSLFIVDEPT
ncbi:MAG: bacterial Ig-like domain-containing protein [Prevotellaceae bacterium]|nr:bacterial Ig-like domain-containing protein [Candidatus Faecinaster equi]